MIKPLVQRLLRPLLRDDAVQSAGRADASLSRPAVRPRQSPFLRRAGHTLVLMPLIVSACQGDNLFSGESSAIRPRASIFAPAVVVSGDSFNVQVFAEAVRGITRIDVGLVGAFFMDTTWFVSGAAVNATPVFKFRAPDIFYGETLVVQARVIDRQGLSSIVSADTAIAILR